MTFKSFQVRGPKWEGAIGLLREPEMKCWSVVYLTCCLGFKQPVSHTLAIRKPIWNEVGVCRTIPSGTECHADTSHLVLTQHKIWPFHLAASSTVYELWRPYAFFSLRIFFPSITLKFTRESQCRVSLSASTFSGLESRCLSAKAFKYQFMYQAQVPVHA